MRAICEDCGERLTAIERHYYGARCEGCERMWFERVELWRRGGQNAELDRLYSVALETKH